VKQTFAVKPRPVRVRARVPAPVLHPLPAGRAPARRQAPGDRTT
jgi:hypothetical protein